MSYLKVVLKSYLLFLLFFASGCITSGEYQSRAPNQAKNSILVKEIVFESEGVTLAGSIYEPKDAQAAVCLLYTSPSPRDLSTSRMPSSA